MFAYRKEVTPFMQRKKGSILLYQTFAFLVEMRGVVGASTRSNSEMSVLAQTNERQPGSGVQVSILLTTPQVYPLHKI